MKAMILAAGLGTRLAPFTHYHPKALAKIGGTTLLEWNVRYLQQAGIRDVVVNVHHFADQIEEAVQASAGWGSSITISDEREKVLETGGGLKKAAPLFAGEEAIVVLNVDVLTDLSLRALITMHEEKNAAATLAVMQRTSSRYLLFDRQMRLQGWRNEATGALKGRPGADFAFSGVQVISGSLLNNMRQEGKFSLIDVYLDAAANGQYIYGFDHSSGRFMDAGKPESLSQAAAMFEDIIQPS